MFDYQTLQSDISKGILILTYNRTLLGATYEVILLSTSIYDLVKDFISPRNRTQILPLVYCQLYTWTQYYKALKQTFWSKF